MNTITISKGAYEWRQELKAAGFKFDGSTKSWTGDADKISLDFQREAILALADRSVVCTMATRNGPGANEIDNRIL